MLSIAYGFPNTKVPTAIYKSDPPPYRVRAAEDGRWHVDACPSPSIDSNDRRSARGGDDGGGR